MPEPIILVIEDDPESRVSVAAALERRFGADYRILTDDCLPWPGSRGPATAASRSRSSSPAGV